MQTTEQSISFDFAPAQQEVHEWMKDKKIGYWGASYVGNKLAEELAEVTEQLLRREKPLQYGSYDASELGLELGDVLFAVICLANTGGQLAETCEGVGRFAAPVFRLQSYKNSAQGLSIFELQSALGIAIGKVNKDIQRLHGPKKKDNFNRKDIEEHLNSVALCVVNIAAAAGLNLGDAWVKAMEKCNIRDANRWKKI